MERFRTSFDNEGRVPMIEEWDRKLGGFLSRFAKLPAAEQKVVLEEVARLRKESENNPERTLERVRILAAMYGSIAEDAESATPEKGKPAPLTVRLGEIAKAFEALSGAQGQGNDKTEWVN